MNILKRKIAPITDEAWKEIIKQTNKVLSNYRTARKFVDIDGPNGLEFGAVSTGKLIKIKNQPKNGVNYGIREVIPLIEIRKPFELNLWELDNINRGAKDADLNPLENAAKEMAFFEENTIYKGFNTGSIKGLIDSSENFVVTLPEKPGDILKFIGSQINLLQRSFVEGPYSLIINENYWLELISLTEGYPIIRQLKDILKGQIIINNRDEKSFIVSERGGDYELILGQDTTIGYDTHDTEKVKLFLTQSFAFRVLSPEAIVVLNR